MPQPIVVSDSISSDGSTTVELALPARDASETICWHWISTVNEDSRGTRNELSVRRASMRRYLKIQRQSNQHYSIDVAPGIELPGDWRICCEFLGSSAGDILRLTAFGTILDAPEAAG